MQDSIFTKIIKGEIPCYKIYEDERTFAFLDIQPESEGHTLVIPKKQVDKIYDLPDVDYVALMKTVKKVSKHMEEVLGERVIWKVMGAEVPHAHVHVMPIDLTWEYGRHLNVPDAEMKRVCEKLALKDD